MQFVSAFAFSDSGCATIDLEIIGFNKLRIAGNIAERTNVHGDGSGFRTKPYAGDISLQRLFNLRMRFECMNRSRRPDTDCKKTRQITNVCANVQDLVAWLEKPPSHFAHTDVKDSLLEDLVANG